MQEVIYVPKINQNGEKMIGDIYKHLLKLFSKIYKRTLSFGFIRWVQMYGSLYEGRYWWMVALYQHFQYSIIYLEKMIKMKISKLKLIKQL